MGSCGEGILKIDLFLLQNRGCLKNCYVCGKNQYIVDEKPWDLKFEIYVPLQALFLVDPKSCCLTTKRLDFR
jgi:hypothetical protein